MIRASIRRPVAVTMVYVSVALLGVAAWRNIPVELLPDVSFPQLGLVFSWPGASPETVEAFATSPLESTIQQVNGVESLTSVSREGGASITVSFERDVDMEFTRLELGERLATVTEELPDGVGPLELQPYVPREFEEEAGRPFLSYTFTGPFLVEALRRHVDEVIAPEIREIPGVSDVEVEGGRRRLLEIELDPDRIASLGLRPAEVQARVRELDLVREAGAVREDGREWAVTIRTRPSSAADLGRTVLSTEPSPVRLAEVARVRDAFQEPRLHYRIDGRPAVGFRIHREYGTNTVRLADVVKARIAELDPLRLPGSELILQDDQSEEIRTQLTDLRTRALVSGAVIFLVLLVFFRSFRAAGVVFATIAFSVLISLNLIYFSGLTLNILTLMGLALGFGLIVDNSIVVLENVERKRSSGAGPRDAAETGTQNVVLPILASTLTTLIVFLPFLYLQGELRVYYLPLAVVVGLTLLASVFVAFSFIPALAARLLSGTSGQQHRGGGRADRSSEARALERVAPSPADPGEPLYIRFYAGLLGYSLRFPWTTVAVAAVCFVASAWVFEEYVPRGRVWGGGAGSESTYIDIRIQLPRGSDLERVDELTRHFEDRLTRMPEVQRFTSRVQGTAANIRVDFPPELEFTPVPLVIEEQLVAYSLEFTGAEVRIYGRGRTFYRGGAAPPNYRIIILGYNYDRLAEIAEGLGARLRGHSRIRDVDTDASGFYDRDRAVEFVAEIDRDAAARHGVTVAGAVAAVRGHLRNSGRNGQVMLGGEPVDFQVRLEGYRNADVRDLEEAVLPTPEGGRVRIGDVIGLRERNVLTSIRREDQQYERAVAYEFRGPRALGDVIRDATLEATVLPPGYSLEERTPWQITAEDERQMIVVLLVALGLIYMVTAALFESVRQPLCVLLAVPMALIGVFLIFFYVDATFTREAYIGVIMMGGIVVNNAILMVDHINRVRRETGRIPGGREAELGSVSGPGGGMGVRSLRDAILRGTLERVRPILMTTATTVLGLLPLVLFMPTADATIWNALTYALIGGLLASTLFVLTVTPSLYLLFERGRPGHATRYTAESVGRSHVPVLLSLTLFPLTFLAACSAESGDRQLVTQVEAGDSAGIHRVHVTDLQGVRLPEVRGRRLWEVTNPELFDVRDAWIEADGSVLVANAGSSEILRVDDEGSFVARIGAEGEGPGEFARHGLAWIDLGQDGRIAAYDERRSRMTWFSAEGTVLESRRVSPPDVVTSLQPLARAGEGRYVATYGDIRDFRILGLKRDTLPVLVVPVGASDPGPEAGSGAPVDTLGVWPGREWLVREIPAGRARIRIPLGLDLLRDGSGPVAAVTPNEALDLRIYRAGSLVGVVHAEPGPRPVTDEDAAHLRDSVASRAPEGMEDVWRGAPVNDVYPDLDALTVVQDGKVWVGLQPEVGADTREFLILSDRGIPVGRLRIPSELEVLAATETHFVARRMDALDREAVELWGIE